MAPTYHSGRKPHGAKRKKPVNTTILSVLLIMVVFAYIYHGLQPENSPNTGEDLNASVGSITTDRGIYHSGEGMSLNVSVEGATENLSVRVYGIRDGRGNYRINDEKTVTTNGSVEFLFSMPPCYGCAGVSPGNYTIICEILSNGTVVANSTKTVELAA
jgi:hypothetical protein